MRRFVAILAAALLAAGVTTSIPPVSASASPAPEPGPVLNILPPGSRGNVNAAQALTFETAGKRPANFADQLEMYDALGRVGPGQLRDSDLTTYYKDAGLGVKPGDVVSTETPRPGVTITRDRYGVPHIKGSSYDDVAFGAGYANIEDRMFLTDILRHTGAADMAEFVGPTPANIAMDREQLRIAPYTTQEANAQIAAIATRYGAEGRRLIGALDAMVAGMNAAQRKLCPLAFGGSLPGDPGAGFGPDCPAEYAALQKPPTPYTPADIVSIASLVGGIFGKGGGGEYANAVWLTQLERKYGDTVGRQIYDDLREKNDTEAPTTSPFAVPYGGGGVDPNLPGVAMPDLGGPSAPGTGADAGSTGTGGAGLPGSLPPNYGVVDGPFGKMDLGLRPHGMSNALLVDAKHSASGHPVVVFGPQTGYYTPQLLVEQELDGPGVHARGVSFAGTNLVVELGRGVDYAWSATSSSDDIVDTVMDRLCNADGSKPTVDSTSYLDASDRCVPMQRYVHSETGLPNAAAQAPPAQLNMLVLKTRHGVVQLRTTVHGVPVAVVTQRSTYGHELDSAVGFARANNPGYVHDAASFKRAFSAVDYTFNWFYVDSRDIAYFNSALLPVRAPGVDGDLPRWGEATYDWRGFVDVAHHPQAVNPPTGYLVSWNNKQAPAFAAADNNWGYGAVYRSLALSDRVRALEQTGGVTRAALVGAMEDAATVDIRGAYVLPVVLDVLGTRGLDAQDTEAVDLLRTWVASGAHRVDRNRTGAYDHQAAIALFDTWWDPKAAGASGSFSLPKDVLRGTLGGLVNALPQGLDDHPRQGIGSAFNDVAWYGYVSKDLRHALGRPVASPYSRTYCGGGSLPACRAQLRASLHAAVQAVLAKQGQHDVSKLTYDKHQDDIRSVTAGIVGVRPIDWQNRPTFQQVVQFSTHRPASSAPVPGSAGGRYRRAVRATAARAAANAPAAGRSAPFTSRAVAAATVAGRAAAWALAVLVAVAALATRLRPRRRRSAGT